MKPLRLGGWRRGRYRPLASKDLEQSQTLTISTGTTLVKPL
jgi:hypothetical protein